MSNESENRIDLTQFEGLTRGEWVYEEGKNGTAWLGTLLIPHIGAETPEHPHGTPYPVLSASGHGYHLTKSDIKAMAAVPDLIAELKKLYEFMDLHQICGCGAICRNMNKEAWARVKRCGFCESPK